MPMDPFVAQATREAAGNLQIKSFDFGWQTYLDDTALGQAIVTQSPNDAIVADTLEEVTAPGFGLALHPDSQVPVAVRFKANAGILDSGAIVMTPGQIVYPHGCAPFSGFDIGLPFGWLGGGSAQVVVLKSPESAVWWAPSTEVVIQRQRVKIQADGANPTYSYGLPTGFPWKNAKRYNATTPTSPFDQGGQALIAASPTRTIFRLRLTALAADATATLLVKNSQALDVDNAGALSGNVIRIPLTFPKIVGSAAYYPTVQIETPYVLFAGDDATFCITNTSGDATLTNAYVDVIRYGLI